MQKKWLGIVTATALMSGFSFIANAAPPDMDDVPLTLSGCVVAGEAKDSFLLTNVEVDGTTLAPTQAFYRFNSTKGLKDHVGRRVEVQGKADLTDVDKGQLRVRAEDGKVTTEVTSERRKIKVEDAWFGSIGSVKMDADIPTYKFEVDNVRRLNGDCSSPRTLP
jgi:hypothetical protein